MNEPKPPAIDWEIIGVFDPDATNDTVDELSMFNYTIGLRDHQLPELWCSALSDNHRIIALPYLAHITNTIAGQLIAGTLQPGDTLHEPSEHGDITFTLDPSPTDEAWDTKQCYQAAPGPVLCIHWNSPLGEQP